MMEAFQVQNVTRTYHMFDLLQKQQSCQQTRQYPDLLGYRFLVVFYVYQTFQVYMVFRPFRPIRAIPHPITIQNIIRGLGDSFFVNATTS